jgi:cyclopropane fatty-acyl-phospholipid synthase-like methyltransferase
MHDASTPRAASVPAQPADYQAIFNERGKAYHQAMVVFPDARSQEFAEILRLANLKPGQVLCDAPSGGGYLPSYLPNTDCEVIALETSETFYQICRNRGTCRAILTELDHIDLPDSSIDCLISLAGLHHLADRAAFFREAHRILKPGGSHCVADVRVDTKVARFLNVFVDRWNSMGHQGDFFDAGAPAELEAAGFNAVEHYYREYHWTFRCIEDMSHCVTLMFGLDRAQPADVLAGIEQYLGYELADGECRMNWGLLFLRGVK